MERLSLTAAATSTKNRNVSENIIEQGLKTIANRVLSYREINPVAIVTTGVQKRLEREHHIYVSEAVRARTLIPSPTVTRLTCLEATKVYPNRRR